MNWNIDSGAHQRAQFSTQEPQDPGKGARFAGGRNEQIARICANALSYSRQMSSANQTPQMSSDSQRATPSTQRLRFKSLESAPLAYSTLGNQQSGRPTFNPLHNRVASAMTGVLSLSRPVSNAAATAAGPAILRLLPTGEQTNRLAPNSAAANRAEINTRLAALQGTFRREGLASNRGLSQDLTQKSTNQLLGQIQQLHDKNRQLMRMAPPDSQQNGKVALRIESEYNQNKGAALVLQKEILQRLKSENGQLTPLMTAVFDNQSPQKFSMDPSNQVRFPLIPPEWNITDAKTREFEQIKARANNLIDQLSYSKFANPDFCAQKSADLNFARQLSRMSPAQIASTVDVVALRQNLMQSQNNMQRARELSQLMTVLNPRRNLADVEAFAHYKTMGFFAAKILKQLDHPSAQGVKSPSSSAFRSATAARVLSENRPVSQQVAPHPSFRANQSSDMRATSRTSRAVSRNMSATREQLPPLGQGSHLVEQSAPLQQNRIAQLRNELQMDQFRAADSAPLARIYQARLNQIEQRGDVRAARLEFQAAKKERQSLQSLIQSMRDAGQTPGEVEQRAFRFYYDKAQTTEGLQLKLESRYS